jgi:hypothetical protein
LCFHAQKQDEYNKLKQKYKEEEVLPSSPLLIVRLFRELDPLAINAAQKISLLNYLIDVT